MNFHISPTHARSGPVGGDQPLSAVVGHRRPAMRPHHRAAVRLSGADRRMAVRRHTMPHRWLPGGDAVVGERVHVHVDLGG